jgi:DNA-binding response OmpR family regulator
MDHPHLDEMPTLNLPECSSPPVVLHVEDDCDFSAALKYRLEAHGVAVVRAFNGDDGIRQAQNQKVDAILLDFDMPLFKGDEVLKALRDNEQTKYLPVIAITGRQDKRLKIRMKQLGASAHLTKPLKFNDLRKQLARFIDILPAPCSSPCSKPSES